MKASDRTSDKQKRKNSFKIFAEDKFESLSREIQNMSESFRLIEMLEEIRGNKFISNNWFEYNFITRTSS